MEIQEELRSRFFPYIKIQPASPILPKFNNWKIHENNHFPYYNDHHHAPYSPVYGPERKQSPRNNHQYFGGQKDRYNKSLDDTFVINHFDMELLNISNNNNNNNNNRYKSPCKSYADAPVPEVLSPTLPEIPAYTIPEIVIPTFELEMIGGANLVYSARDFDEQHVRLDCLVKMQVEVVNNSEGENGFDPEKISLGEGNLRIFLNKNYVTLITFSDMQNERSPKPLFQFITPLFHDLVRSSYAANSEMKSISWNGISTQLKDKTEGVALEPKKQLNRFTATFPKTRIFIHATNVFVECNHAAEGSGISMENFLQMTNRDVPLKSAPDTNLD